VALGLATLAMLVMAWPQRDARAQGPGRVELVGLTVASHLVAVASEQPGTIVAMPVTDGTRIKKGDVLFQLGSRLEQLEVDRLRALIGSDLEHSRAAASLQFAREKAERMRELSAQQISAAASLQEVELESELARLSLGKVEFEREQLQNELLRAEEHLAQRTLRSALDGVVTRRFKQLGETTEQLVPVLEVMSLDPLCVEFECPVAEARRFRLGDFVRVRTAVGESLPRLAEITHVSLKATPASHAFLVRAAMANHDYALRSGLKVYVQAAEVPGAAPAQGK
jgi:RND family efflux transporter MFP subunit